MKTAKICEYCHSYFETDKPFKKYCSDDCRLDDISQKRKTASNRIKDKKEIDQLAEFESDE